MFYSQNVKCTIQTIIVAHGLASECSAALYECGGCRSNGEQMEGFRKLCSYPFFGMVCLFPLEPSCVGMAIRIDV